MPARFAALLLIARHAALGQDFIPAGYNIPCTSPESPDCNRCKMKKNKKDRGRRRYEVRDMPKEEWETYVFVLNEMNSLSLEEGRNLYGPLFKTMDYFTVQHSVAHTSVRGDQGHFGAHLMSFHGVLTLAFETTILAIADVADKPLSGVPYFWNLDSDVSTVFGPDYFGTHPGIGENYEVADGAFPDWTIPTDFDRNDWSDFILNETDYPYVGNNGIMRSETNANPSPRYFSYPVLSNSTVDQIYQGFPYEKVLECLETPYDAETFTLVNFTFCIDEFDISLLPDNVPFENAWHIGTHYYLGSYPARNNEKYKEEMANYEGDFFDLIVGTHSPYFMPLHALLDMFVREWTSRNAAYADETWGFPYAKAINWASMIAYDGINGEDVISSSMPIYWMDVGWAKPGSRKACRTITHSEAHCRLANENSPYIYVQYSGAPDTAPGVVLDDSSGEKSKRKKKTSKVKGKRKGKGRKRADLCQGKSMKTSKKARKNVFVPNLS